MQFSSLFFNYTKAFLISVQLQKPIEKTSGSKGEKQKKNRRCRKRKKRNENGDSVMAFVQMEGVNSIESLCNLRRKGSHFNSM